MANKPSTPFSNGTEYIDFQYQFCERCTNYREREDGFPELVENGGCPILDACEYARFDVNRFPTEWLRELSNDETGKPIAWHYCVRFQNTDYENVMKPYFELMKKAILKEKSNDSCYST